MREPLPFRWALSLCSGSALLLILAFPYTRCWPLTFFCLVPLMLALRGQGALRGVLFGMLHGFLFQSYIMFWANFFGPPAYLFLAGYKTVLPALFGGLWGWLSRRSSRGLPLAFVSGWVGLEYLQTFGPFGVTWGMLSHAWSRLPVALQGCSLLGPWTWSLVLLMVNASLYVALRPECKSQRRPWWLATAVALGLNFGFGVWRLEQDWGPGVPFVAASVQNSMGRNVRWDPRFAQLALEKLERLTCEAASHGARLIVWPETAIPFRDFRRLPNLTLQVGMLGLTTHSWLIVGSIEKVGDEAQHTLNSASLISPQGGFEGRYDKQRLVPGGEYLPLESWLRPYKIFDRVMRYQPGPESVGVFSCPELKIHPGMLICFESMVPYLAAQRVRDGADVLVVATNDGWFGSDPAIVHHFEMAIFRAIEQGRPVIQCGTTGISGMIDGRGRVLRETPISQEAVAVCPLQARTGRTLYARLGDVLPWLALTLFLACLGWARGTQPEAGKD